MKVYFCDIWVFLFDCRVENGPTCFAGNINICFGCDEFLRSTFIRSRTGDMTWSHRCDLCVSRLNCGEECRSSIDDFIQINSALDHFLKQHKVEPETQTKSVSPLQVPWIPSERRRRRAIFPHRGQSHQPPLRRGTSRKQKPLKHGYRDIAGTSAITV